MLWTNERSQYTFISAADNLHQNKNKNARKTLSPLPGNIPPLPGNIPPLPGNSIISPLPGNRQRLSLARQNKPETQSVETTTTPMISQSLLNWNWDNSFSWTQSKKGPERVTRLVRGPVRQQIRERKHAAGEERTAQFLSEKASESTSDHSYPGNVSEEISQRLRNVAPPETCRDVSSLWDWGKVTSFLMCSLHGSKIDETVVLSVVADTGQGIHHR